MRKFWIMVLVCATIVALTVGYSYWKSTRPKLAVTTELTPEENIRIQLKLFNPDDSLLQVNVWSEKTRDYLWSLDADYAAFEELTYGIVPRVPGRHGNSPPSQRFPTNNAPPRTIDNNEIFYVAVTVQSDASFPPAPGMGTKIFRYQKLENGISELPLANNLVLPRDSLPQKKVL